MINNLLLRMKLSNENPETRLAALDKIPSSEQEIFFEVAGSDSDPSVRRAAAYRLDDESMLEKLWEKEADQELKQSIRERLNRRYIAYLSEGRAVDLQYLERIDDELLLVTAICSTQNAEIIKQVSALVKSDGGIVKILRNLDNYELGIKLLERLDHNKELLMDIAETAANPQLKEYARNKFIAEPGHEDVAELQQTAGISSGLKEKLHAYENIIAEVQRLTGYIGEDAAERLQGLKDNWRTLPEVSPSFMEVLDIEFKQACRNFEDGIETARKLQQDRLHRIDQLDAIYAEAVKLVSDSAVPVKKEVLTRLRKNWETAAEGMTTIEPLQERFAKACDELESRLQESQKLISDNLARLQEIIAELEAQVKLDDPDISRDRRIELENEVNDLVAKSSGNHQVNTLRDRFHATNKTLRHKIHELHQVRDLARHENYALKIVLCQQAEKLLENTNMHEVSHQFKEIRQRWKDIGMVPHDKLNEINARFHLVADELTRRCSEFFDMLNKQREEIAAAKDALCAEAETLQDSTEWNKTGDRFKEMQKQWRELGLAQQGVENKLMKRFRAACDIFFNARRVHLDELTSRRNQAIEAKNALCAEAKELLENNPAELNRRSKQMWDRWRDAGSAGRDDHQLYEKFKAIFDSFYNQKRNEREDNLNLKKQICEELRNLAIGLDPLKIEAGQKRLHELQNQWDQIGQVPRENEKDLWRDYDHLIKDIHKNFKSLYIRHDRQVVDLQEQLCLIIARLQADRDAQAAREAVEALGSVPSELNALHQLFDKAAAGEISAAEQDAALQEMKKICADFERLNGIETEAEAAATLGDMLADLNAALQNNIATSSQDNTHHSKTQNTKELLQRWHQAGVPPLDEIAPVFARFRIAAKLV